MKSSENQKTKKNRTDNKNR